MAVGLRSTAAPATPIPRARRCGHCTMPPASPLPMPPGGGESITCCGPRRKDGSWHVVSRLHPPAPVSPPYFETGHPYGHDQFISSHGRELGRRRPGADASAQVESKLPPLKEAEPQGIEPWAETVLFGSAADVKRLLDERIRSQLGDEIRRDYRADDGRAGCRQNEAAARSRRQRRCAGQEPVLRAVGRGQLSRIERGHEPVAGPRRHRASAEGPRRAAVQCAPDDPGSVRGQCRHHRPPAQRRRSASTTK